MKKILFILIIFILEISIASASSCVAVKGSGNQIGDEIACGQEHFYIVSNDGENVKMLGKYNLLVGTTYYQLTFKQTYTVYQDIYYDKELRDKLNEGYEIYSHKQIYDANLGKKVYSGVVLTKPATLTSPTNKYIFYDEVKNIEEILKTAEVQEYLKKGYTYSLVKSSTGENIGIKLMKIAGYTYAILVLDNTYDSYEEMLNTPKVSKVLSNHYLSTYLVDSQGKYFGIVAYQRAGYEYKTIVLEESVDPPFVLQEEKISKVLEEDDWAIDKEITGTETYSWRGLIDCKKYIGIVLYKRNGYQYKTIPTKYDSIYYPDTDEKKIYQQPEVKQLYNDGYIPFEYHYFSHVYGEGYPVYRAIYGITLMKEDSYDYYNIMFDEEISSDEINDYITNNEEIKAKKQENYSIVLRYQLYYDRSSSRYYKTYGVQMRKSKLNTNDDNSTQTSNKNFTKVYQDESAIGAHGGEHGKPAPIEVGILLRSYLAGEFNENLKEYDTGFRDYYYNESSYAHEKLENYRQTLIANGYNIISADSITVSEINELAKQVTGKYLPLEEWYQNSEEYGEDPIHGTQFWILGSLPDYFPEEYSWLWGTTYWTKTVDPSWSNYYFIDTLGDLCSNNYCDGMVGAGIRPLVTISSEDIIYNIETKTDGNGTLEATHESAKTGEEIKFTIEPKKGYVLKEVKVTDAKGNVVIFTDNTFTMPNANVLIEATFEVKNPNTISISIIASLLFVIISFISIKIYYPKMKWLDE